MLIGRYDSDQVRAVLEMWKISLPVDVAAFLGRCDVPEVVKNRVRLAGLDPSKISRHPDDAYRKMPARVVIEVVKYQPLTPVEI